jgi:hypothetical protein
MSTTTVEDVTDDELWRDGYDAGHEHGSAGLPNMLDVRGRPMAEVIDMRRWLLKRRATL